MSRSDRPLSRSLIQFAFSLAGQKWRHARAWWPGLSLELPTSGLSGTIIYRGQTVGALQAHFLFSGRANEAIHLIASGPSINSCDLSRVPPASAILVNGAIHLIGGKIQTPLAVAIEDERFVWRHSRLMREKISQDVPCFFSVAVLRALCEIDSGWLAGRTIMLIDDVQKPYGRPRRQWDDLAAEDWIVTDPQTRAAISLDPGRGVVQAGSVAVSALQIALYARPGLLGILGVDLNNAGQPRFYETKGTEAKSGIAKAQDRIGVHFALARRIGEEHGIRFECYSPVSALLDFGFDYSDRFAK